MYSRNEYDEKFLRAVMSSCQKNPGAKQYPGNFLFYPLNIVYFEVHLFLLTLYITELV